MHDHKIDLLAYPCLLLNYTEWQEFESIHWLSAYKWIFKVTYVQRNLLSSHKNRNHINVLFFSL